MRFTNLDRKLTDAEISSVEIELGIRFPKSLRELFANYNGGSPDPYVIQVEGLHTVVNETLPLLSSKDFGTAVDSYKLLVQKRRIVEKKYFPFAVDAGGDYFFVDCFSTDSQVYFYDSDTDSVQDRLLKLGMTLQEFWNRLKSED
ncbi:MAG: SMI1/KNR4 family protein [Zavarzinella sp.]